MAIAVTHGTMSESDHSAQLRKAVIASTIGTAIEWYDFFLYAPFIRRRSKAALSWRPTSFRVVSEPAMKMLTEYLERAVNLERLAASEQDSRFKTELLNRAATYREMANSSCRAARPTAPESARTFQDQGEPQG